MTGQRTKAPPRTIGGTIFRCYHVGVLRYVWRTDDGALEVGSWGQHTSTYFARVNGETLKRRFRSLDTAMRGAVERWRKNAYG